MIRFLAVLIYLFVVAFFIAVGIGIGRMMLADEPASKQFEERKKPWNSKLQTTR